MDINIGIIGAGAIGQALAKSFKSETKILFWDLDKSKCTVSSLEDLVEKSQIIFLAVPSWAVKPTVEKIKVGKNKAVVCVAKGVEVGFVSMAEVLQKASKGSYEPGILYGPMLASELEDNKPTAAVLAIKNKTMFDNIRSLSTDNFTLQYSNDPYSVSLCGALKNIYAIALGINDGLGLGSNAKGVLTTRIIYEMQAVLRDLKADPSVTLGLAGIGDLLATGFSELSFNHRIGMSIANNEPIKKNSSEGVNALVEIGGAVDLKKFELLSKLHNIVYGKISTKEMKGIV